MCRHLTDGRIHTGFQYTYPNFGGSYIRESENTFVTDIGRASNLLPLSVHPCIDGMFLHPFAMCGDGFLNHNPIESNGLRYGKDQFFRSFTIQEYKCIFILVQYLLRTICSVQQVMTIGFLNSSTGLFQNLDIGIREPSLPVRRNIQQENGVTTYGTFINVEYIIGTPGLLTGIVPVEPPSPDRRIRFGRLIMQVKRFFTAQQHFPTSQVTVQVHEFHHLGRILRIRSNHIPFGCPCISGLITTPAHVFSSEDCSIRHQCTNHFTPSLIVIFLTSFSLRMRTIEPYFVNRSVFRQQFEQLVQEIFVIIVQLELEFCLDGERTPGYFPRNGTQRIRTQVTIKPVRTFYLIQIGRRQVDTQFQSIFPARSRKFFHDIAFPILISSRHDTVFGITALPQYESVMMLGCKDDHLHTGGLHGLTPLVGIQGLQIKDLGVFLSRSPFQTGEGIRTEMDESYKLVSQSSQLIVRRNHMGRFPDNHIIGISRLHFNGILGNYLLLLCIR